MRRNGGDDVKESPGSASEGQSRPPIAGEEALCSREGRGLGEGRKGRVEKQDRGCRVQDCGSLMGCKGRPCRRGCACGCRGRPRESCKCEECFFFLCFLFLCPFAPFFTFSFSLFFFFSFSLSLCLFFPLPLLPPPSTLPLPILSPPPRHASSHPIPGGFNGRAGRSRAGGGRGADGRADGRAARRRVSTHPALRHDVTSAPYQEPRR